MASYHVPSSSDDRLWIISMGNTWRRTPSWRVPWTANLWLSQRPKLSADLDVMIQVFRYRAFAWGTKWRRASLRAFNSEKSKWSVIRWNSSIIHGESLNISGGIRLRSCHDCRYPVQVLRCSWTRGIVSPPPILISSTHIQLEHYHQNSSTPYFFHNMYKQHRNRKLRRRLDDRKYSVP